MSQGTGAAMTPGRVASVEAIRAHFPALGRTEQGHPVAYFDGPGGTQVPRGVADAMVDYLLDVPFQESMPLSLFVFPVNPQAKLPDLFTKFAVRAASPLTLDPDVIAENRDEWLDEWRAIAL